MAGKAFAAQSAGAALLAKIEDDPGQGKAKLAGIEKVLSEVG